MNSILNKPVKPSNFIFGIGIPTSKNDFYNDLKTDNKHFAKTIKGEWAQFNAEVLPTIKLAISIMKKLGVRVISEMTLKMFGNILKANPTEIVILFTHWKNEPFKLEFSKYDFLNLLSDNIQLLKILTYSNDLAIFLTDQGYSLEAKDDYIVDLIEENIIFSSNTFIENYIDKIEIELFEKILSYSNSSKVEFKDGLSSLFDVISEIPEEFQGIIDLNVCHPDLLTIFLRKCRPKCHIKYKFDNSNIHKNIGVNPVIALYFYIAFFNHLNTHNLNYFEGIQEVINSFFKTI